MGYTDFANILSSKATYKPVERFAAEHGIGRTKTVLVNALRDPVERNLIARLKKSLDDTN